MLHRVLAKYISHLSSGSMDPSFVIFLDLEHTVRKDTPSNWHDPHSGLSTSGLRTIWIRTGQSGSPGTRPLTPPAQPTTVNQNHIHGNQRLGISATKVRGAGTVISTTSPFDLPVRSGQKPPGSWRITTDDYKFNQATMPAIATVSDVANQFRPWHLVCFRFHSNQ